MRSKDYARAKKLIEAGFEYVCSHDEAMLFINRVKKAIRDPNATEEYEIVYVCTDCGKEIRKEDLPLY